MGEREERLQGAVRRIFRDELPPPRLFAYPVCRLVRRSVPALHHLIDVLIARKSRSLPKSIESGNIGGMGINRQFSFRGYCDKGVGQEFGG